MENARFVPPGADKLRDAIGSWEKFMHADSQDLLVQLAIVHAEFEALHPFPAGNGRIGRMLIPLFLWKNGLIRKPTFYISAYLEANRVAYFEKLLAVSRDHNWTDWCRFFVNAPHIQAESNLRKTQNILALYETMKKRIGEITHSRHAIRALDWLFEKPIFEASDFSKYADIPRATSTRLLTAL